MKLLLDESIPRKLAELFLKGVEAVTVPQLGWAGMKNGQLLRQAIKSGFDGLITADRGMEDQQNLSTLGLPIAILVAFRTRLQDLAPLVPMAVDLLRREIKAGVYRISVLDTE